MATSIEIASNALVRIGAAPISSFTEGGASGQAAANLYEPTIQALLTEHRWRFSSAKRKLARLVSKPLNEYNYAFQLPSDLLLMYRAYPTDQYKIFENLLYSNSPSMEIDYVYRANEKLFPAYFQLACEYKLASEFALIVTSNRSLAETYQIKHQDQMKKARFADAQGQPPNTIQSFDYLDVRG